MTDKIYLQEEYVNRTENYRCGDSGIYESWCDTPGDAYRAMQSEYGRCTGKVYIDTPDGSAKHIGWVFVKRQKYDDTPDTFLLETWVTLHSAPPTRRTEYHYWEM